MLYLHTDIFFPEMTAQVLWILTSFMFLKLKDIPGKLFNYSFFIVLFLFLYTEWLAVFFVFSVIIYLVLKKKYPDRGKLIILSTIVLVCAALIMLIQYASISGIDNLFHAMGIRFLERSGFFGQKYSSMGVHIFSLDSLKLFYLNMHKTLGWSGYILVSLFFIILFIKRKSLNSDNGLIFFAVACPLLLHWLVFFNANALHLMLMPRIIFPLSISVAFITYYFIQNYKSPRNQKIMISFVCLIFIIYAAYSYRKDFIINEKYPQLHKIGVFIKNNAHSNQAVFVQSLSDIPEPEKYLTFITKRNIVRVPAQKQAMDFLKNRNSGHEAIIFNIDTIRNDDTIPFTIISSN